MKIEVQKEILSLLPERAFFWEKQKVLGFSDVHLGKADSFQKAGIPLPSETHDEDLRQIQHLIESHRPKRIVILGDFIHDKNSWSDVLFWRLQKFLNFHSQIEWNLILGNHERGSLDYLQQLPFLLHHERMDLGPFRLVHGHHERTEGSFQIEGHIHPIVTLTSGPLRMRFPCFVLEKSRLLLPAFGALTGGVEARPQFGLRRFAVTPAEVFEIAHSPDQSRDENL